MTATIWKRIPRRKAAIRVAAGGLIIYSAILSLLMFFERTLLFPSPPLNRGNWQAERFGAQEHYLESTDNVKVHVWSLMKKGATKTLIFCHGNGETLGILSNELAAIRDRWNVNVVAFDFRGYGKTGGVASEPGILADATLVGKWVDDQPPLKGTKLIVIGRSLGGAPAVEIATKFQVDGLILDRTFSATVDVAASRYPIFPVRFVMQNQFRSIAKIRKYHGPLYQMHGDVDEVIPYRFGKRLFEACPSENKELLTVPGLYHNDLWPEDFWIGGKKFIDAL
jgi:uncharacterized protein